MVSSTLQSLVRGVFVLCIVCQTYCSGGMTAVYDTDSAPCSFYASHESAPKSFHDISSKLSIHRGYPCTRCGCASTECQHAFANHSKYTRANGLSATFPLQLRHRDTTASLVDWFVAPATPMPGTMHTNEAESNRTYVHIFLSLQPTCNESDTRSNFLEPHSASHVRPLLALCRIPLCMNGTNAVLTESSDVSFASSAPMMVVDVRFSPAMQRVVVLYGLRIDHTPSDQKQFSSHATMYSFSKQTPTASTTTTTTSYTNNNTATLPNATNFLPPAPRLHLMRDCFAWTHGELRKLRHEYILRAAIARAPQLARRRLTSYPSSNAGLEVAQDEHVRGTASGAASTLTSALFAHVTSAEGKECSAHRRVALLVLLTPRNRLRLVLFRLPRHEMHTTRTTSAVAEIIACTDKRNVYIRTPWMAGREDQLAYTTKLPQRSERATHSVHSDEDEVRSAQADWAVLNALSKTDAVQLHSSCYDDRHGVGVVITQTPSRQDVNMKPYAGDLRLTFFAISSRDSKKGLNREGNNIRDSSYPNEVRLLKSVSWSTLIDLGMTARQERMSHTDDRAGGESGVHETENSSSTDSKKHGGPFTDERCNEENDEHACSCCGDGAVTATCKVNADTRLSADARPDTTTTGNHAFSVFVVDVQLSTAKNDVLTALPLRGSCRATYRVVLKESYLNEYRGGATMHQNSHAKVPDDTRVTDNDGIDVRSDEGSDRRRTFCQVQSVARVGCTTKSTGRAKYIHDAQALHLTLRSWIAATWAKHRQAPGRQHPLRTTGRILDASTLSTDTSFVVGYAQHAAYTCIPHPPWRRLAQFVQAYIWHLYYCDARSYFIRPGQSAGTDLSSLFRSLRDSLVMLHTCAYGQAATSVRACTEYVYTIRSLGSEDARQWPLVRQLWHTSIPHTCHETTQVPTHMDDGCAERPRAARYLAPPQLTAKSLSRGCREAMTVWWQPPRMLRTGDFLASSCMDLGFTIYELVFLCVMVVCVIAVAVKARSFYFSHAMQNRHTAQTEDIYNNNIGLTVRRQPFPR